MCEVGHRINFSVCLIVTIVRTADRRLIQQLPHIATAVLTQLPHIATAGLTQLPRISTAVSTRLSNIATFVGVCVGWKGRVFGGKVREKWFNHFCKDNFLTITDKVYMYIILLFDNLCQQRAH